LVLGSYLFIFQGTVLQQGESRFAYGDRNFLVFESSCHLLIPV